MNAVEDSTDRIMKELRERGAPERAAREKDYLKSDLVHLGVPVPDIRRTVRPAAGTRAGTLALAGALWAVTDSGTPVHEARMAAVEVLVRNVGALAAEDAAFAERLVRDSVSWVYVDVLADKVVGALVLRFPELAGTLDRWVADPWMWIRRTSLLALLPGIRAGAPDRERLSRYGEALIGEREFFIRKALGWVLRELSKRDPGWVRGWTEAHLGEMSGVTFREAVRRLPERDAAALTAAYRAR
ncbi:DNA alkylation repair protein [Actinomadura kijaniata]|uniref:DNA alkylation repair protein n=1 Tax=Actinomadura kijaniata TaxID=46161 RepID=UPI0009FD6B21|nr:DNA alkylation repair protein [Actinomadura kijaniata]